MNKTIVLKRKYQSYYQFEFQRTICPVHPLWSTKLWTNFVFDTFEPCIEWTPAECNNGLEFNCENVFNYTRPKIITTNPTTPQ